MEKSVDGKFPGLRHNVLYDGCPNENDIACIYYPVSNSAAMYMYYLYYDMLLIHATYYAKISRKMSSIFYLLETVVKIYFTQVLFLFPGTPFTSMVQLSPQQE